LDAKYESHLYQLFNNDFVSIETQIMLAELFLTSSVFNTNLGSGSKDAKATAMRTYFEATGWSNIATKLALAEDGYNTPTSTRAPTDFFNFLSSRSDVTASSYHNLAKQLVLADRLDLLTQRSSSGAQFLKGSSQALLRNYNKRYLDIDYAAEFAAKRATLGFASVQNVAFNFNTFGMQFENQYQFMATSTTSTTTPNYLTVQEYYGPPQSESTMSQFPFQAAT
jgi:hypothetical protein